MDSKKLFGKKALLDNIDFIDYVILINKDNSLINLLNQKQIKYQFINKQYFNKFDHSLNHQGIVSFLKQPKSINNLDDFLKLSKDKSIVLIIDSIQDPQNFGAILRTCDAFNVDAVIYKKDNQVQINDFVIKSSMGAINYLNMIRVSNLSNIVQVLKKAGYWIYASSLDKESKDFSNIKFEKKSVLIVGNEQNGISPLLLKQADFLINIPMHGHMQSLNVSVATGILLNKIKKSFKKI